MKMTEKAAEKKARQHTVYKLADGSRVPGVTTLTGVMAKPQLVPWANALGLQGLKVSEYVDTLAEIGTLAHDGIHCHLLGKEWLTDAYSKDQIDAAETSIIKWHYWADKQKITVIKSEASLVSEKHRFGGTCDLYCELNGKKALIDLKTSKAIYDEMFTQVAGYKILLEENGMPVDECYIVSIGRNADEGTEAEVKQITNISLHEKRLLCCRELYELNKQCKGD